MTTKELLQLSLKDVNAMSRDELRQATSQLRSTARKRYERIEETGALSPAAKTLQRGKSKRVYFPTVRKMDETTLKNEYRKYKSYLSQSTSTRRGALKFSERKRAEFKEMTGVSLNDKYLKKFWDIFEEMNQSELAPALHYQELKGFIEDVFLSHKSRSKKKLLEEIRERANATIRYREQPPAVYPSRTIQD